MKVFGRDGRELSDEWRDGAAAHLGIAVPGFPNLFLVHGPHTALRAGSVVHMIECQARYVRQAVRRLAAGTRTPRGPPRGGGRLRRRDGGALGTRTPERARVARHDARVRAPHRAASRTRTSWPPGRRTGPATATGERCPAPSVDFTCGFACSAAASILRTCVRPCFGPPGRPSHVRADAPPSGSRGRSRSRPAAPRHRCPCRTRPGCSSRRRSSAARRRPRGPPRWAGPGCCGTG